MPIARIITPLPEDAEPLRRRLQQRGYDVEVVAPGEASSQHAELEVEVERCPAEQAVQHALAEKGEAQVFVAPGVLEAQAPAPQPATGTTGTNQTAPAAPPVAAVRREPRFRKALAAALGDAGRAFRWAGRAAGHRLLDGVEAGSEWLARVGPRLKPLARRSQRVAAGVESGLGAASRAGLTSARGVAYGFGAAVRRARRRSALLLQGWWQVLLHGQRTLRDDWREFLEARRDHRAAALEREALLRRRELGTRRREETERLAQPAPRPALHTAPLPAEPARSRRVPLFPAPILRPRRLAAGATLVALLAVVLWTGFSGRRPSDFLPPSQTPQAGMQLAPFAPEAAAEVAPAALNAPQVDDRPPSEDAAKAEAEPVPPPVVRREREVVIRHFERPERREPTTQQSQVKKITDLD